MVYVCLLQLLVCVNIVRGIFWKNGIVHYAINIMDYDVHSQDVIATTLSQLQNEICIRFFQTSPDFNATANEKILYINNPDKRKTCSSNMYDFSKTVVDMPIGYKCVNQRDIARTVVEMLWASIGNRSPVNSYDLVKRFEEKDSNGVKTTLLTEWERNFINSHYKSECNFVSLPIQLTVQRRSDKDALDSTQLSDANLNFYNDKLWPFAVVLYGAENELKDTDEFKTLRNAMTTIELSTCVVFQEVLSEDDLLPLSVIWFVKEGEVMPKLGFVHGNQTIKLSSMINGAPGHTAHIINSLLRILGVPMMSNRYDRDNHIIINWRNIEMGKEQYLEKMSKDAWVVQIPYDFNSVTHAPANYLCSNCELGATTVQPIQDKLWQRTLSMGHTKELSESDIQFIHLLYNKQCNTRYMNH